jgi:hypothetical protein
MHADIATRHAALKLHRTPADGIETMFIIAAQWLDNGAEPADGLVDKFTMSVAEVADGGRVIRD